MGEQGSINWSVLWSIINGSTLHKPAFPPNRIRITIQNTKPDKISAGKDASFFTYSKQQHCNIHIASNQTIYSRNRRHCLYILAIQHRTMEAEIKRPIKFLCEKKNIN